MQAARQSSPYLKQVQYLGEINRLKRITLFLRTVAKLCDVDNHDRRMHRNSLAADHGVESEERAFIEDCRQRLEAVASCSSYHEIYDDLLCRFIILEAQKVSGRRVPLIADLNRLKHIAQQYHDGRIKDVVTSLTVSYSNSDTPGKASEGATLMISLTQKNALKVNGGSPELRKKIKSALGNLPKLPNKQHATRRAFLDEQVRSVLQATSIPGWYCTYIELVSSDYAVYDDGSQWALESILPSSVENHVGFYEQAFLWSVIDDLSPDQQQAVGKFLHPKDYNGNIVQTIYAADIEDVYRVLMYLKQLKKSSK